KKQITEANAQIKKHIEQRDALHDKVKKSREEIRQIKAERDSLNQKVKELKGQRDAIRTQTAPIMDELKVIDEKIEALKKNLPRISQRELQEEHDAIEWKISTTSLDLQEEKRLIEHVKTIEIQMSGYKKIDVQNKKIKDLLSKRKVFDDQADVFHKELTETAKKSQDLHAVMMEKVNIMKRDKAEADSLHQAFIKAKENNNLLYAQIKLLVGQSISLRNASREQYQSRRKDEDAKRAQEDAKRKEEQAARAVKEQAIKEKIGSEAREKLNRGEKVSWDEFAMMLGDEKDDAETQA
ncbi:MAG: hypothetical protein ACM3JE_04375, partial [Betaproteobacteria bacterium]